MAIPNASNYEETHDEGMTCDTISVTEDNKGNNVNNDTDDNGNDRSSDLAALGRKKIFFCDALSVTVATLMTCLMNCISGC